MNALDQFPDDDAQDDLPPQDLPPGETPDDFDAAPVDDLDDDPFVDEADAPKTPSEERDWEAEAKEMGWRDPKQTGRGVSAKEFVLGSRREGERLLSQVDQLSQSIHQMRAEQRKAEMAARVDGYRRALMSIRAERERAKQEYDVEALDRSYEQEQQLLNSAREEAARMQQEQQPQPQVQNGPDPVWDGWVAENQWYDKDPELQQAADSVGAVFAQQGLTGRALMDRVAEAVRTAYPQKFTNTRRRSAPVSDSSRASQRDSVDGLRSMPNEVRAAFTDFYDEHGAEFKSKDAARKYFMDLMKGDN